MSWKVIYEAGVPVRMQWRPDGRTKRRCPRTYPHTAHGPWHTGEIVRAGEVTAFDCPGVPMPGGQR